MLDSIDLNCDLGETLDGAIDAVLMSHISSCNIACGGHAGDRQTMARTVQSALVNGVQIGAHPSYPDRHHFGRRSLDLPIDHLVAVIIEQCGRLAEVAAQEGGQVRHVKPHGALYHDLARDPDKADAVLHAIRSLDPELTIYGLADSPLAKQAEEIGIIYVHEVFADRRYDTNTRLRSRENPNALLTETDQVLSQVEELLRGSITTLEGRQPITARSLCVHGDTPGAVEMVAQIAAFLQQHHVEIHPPH